MEQQCSKRSPLPWCEEIMKGVSERKRAIEFNSLSHILACNENCLSRSLYSIYVHEHFPFFPPLLSFDLLIAVFK